MAQLQVVLQAVVLRRLCIGKRIPTYRGVESVLQNLRWQVE